MQMKLASAFILLIILALNPTFLLKMIATIAILGGVGIAGAWLINLAETAYSRPFDKNNRHKVS